MQQLGKVVTAASARARALGHVLSTVPWRWPAGMRSLPAPPAGSTNLPGSSYCGKGTGCPGCSKRVRSAGTLGAGPWAVHGTWYILLRDGRCSCTWYAAALPHDRPVKYRIPQSVRTSNVHRGYWAASTRYGLQGSTPRCWPPSAPASTGTWVLGCVSTTTMYSTAHPRHLSSSFAAGQHRNQASFSSPPVPSSRPRWLVLDRDRALALPSPSPAQHTAHSTACAIVQADMLWTGGRQELLFETEWQTHSTDSTPEPAPSCDPGPD